MRSELNDEEQSGEFDCRADRGSGDCRDWQTIRRVDGRQCAASSYD
jgi:hypothetical protein